MADGAPRPPAWDAAAIKDFLSFPALPSAAGFIWYNACIAWALRLNLTQRRSWGRYPSSHSHRIEQGATQPPDRGDGPNVATVRLARLRNGSQPIPVVS